MQWHNRRLTLASLRAEGRGNDPFLLSVQRLRQQPDFVSGRLESDCGSLPYLLATLPIAPGLCWIQFGMGQNPDGKERFSLDPRRSPEDSATVLSFLQALIERVLTPHPATQFALTLPEDTPLSESLEAVGFRRNTLRWNATQRGRQEIWLLQKHNLPFAAWGILPSPVGLFAIYEEQGQILESLFLHDRARVENSWLLDFLQWHGYLPPQAIEYRKELDICRRRSVPEGHPILEEAIDQADAYFKGERRSFDLPMRFRAGTPFQIRIWELLRTIPYGDTIPYLELAARYVADQWGEAFALSSEGRRKIRTLTRAVGSACSNNPLSLFLPCHRVIGKDGHLVGYREGLDIKKALLEFEILGLLPRGGPYGKREV